MVILCILFAAAYSSCSVVTLTTAAEASRGLMFKIQHNNMDNLYKNETTVHKKYTSPFQQTNVLNIYVKVATQSYIQTHTLQPVI